MNFETETETQLKVVETIMDKTNQNCPRLEILWLSRLRLFETPKIHGCRDRDSLRLRKSVGVETETGQRLLRLRFFREFR